jgi:peroxiredoxin
MRETRTAIIAIAATSLLAAKSPAAADALPDLTLADLSGTVRSLGDYRGQILVVNFWATWCVPCREEMPMLVSVHREYAARGVQMIGASADSPGKAKAVRRFVREMQIPFPIWLGATTEHMESLELGHELPATIVLDRVGQPVGRILGMARADELRAYLDWLLADRTSTAPPPRIEHPGEAATSDHHHNEEEHAHGGVGVEGASIVPS